MWPRAPRKLSPGCRTFARSRLWCSVGTSRPPATWALENHPFQVSSRQCSRKGVRACTRMSWYERFRSRLRPRHRAGRKCAKTCRTTAPLPRKGRRRVKLMQGRIHRKQFAVSVERGEMHNCQSWLEELRRHEPPLTPFHWEIEFPEVFDRENPGFDAVVGNPPFLGGKRNRRGRLGHPQETLPLSLARRGPRRGPLPPPGAQRRASGVGAPDRLHCRHRESRGARGRRPHGHDARNSPASAPTTGTLWDETP